MSTTFTHSSKLSDLWDRICDKDTVYEAESAFGDCCNRQIDSNNSSTFELLEEGATLEGDFFVYETDDGTVYLFDQATEAAAYNAVLRDWCANTDRKTKKKGT